MKKVNKENLQAAISFYLNESRGAQFYFDSSLEAESKYLDHHKVRYYSVLKQVERALEDKKISSPRVLEIGFSPMSFILAYFFDKTEYLTVVDHSEEFRGRIESLGVDFMCADLSVGLRASQNFDVIIFNEVFEHIFCDEHRLLTSISECLRPNGLLLFSTPNYSSLKNLALFMVGENLTPLNRDILQSDGSLHVREYSMKEIMNLFSHINSLKVVSCKYETYFEGIRTLLVYRQNKILALIPIVLYTTVTKLFPKLRMGMSFIVRKI